jgi:hypothetical protein
MVELMRYTISRVHRVGSSLTLKRGVNAIVPNQAPIN